MNEYPQGPSRPSVLKRELLTEQAELIDEATTWRALSKEGFLTYTSTFGDARIMPGMSVGMFNELGDQRRSRGEMPNRGKQIRVVNHGNSSEACSTSTNSFKMPCTSHNTTLPTERYGIGRNLEHWQSTVPILRTPLTLYAQLQARRLQRGGKPIDPSPTIRNPKAQGKVRPCSNSLYAGSIRTIPSGTALDLKSFSRETSSSRDEPEAPASISEHNLYERLLDFHKPGATGAAGVAWTYRTNTELDIELRGCGIFIFQPPSSYYSSENVPTIMMNGVIIEAPVRVEPNTYILREQPIISFDGVCVTIQPHFPAWEDNRSSISHPDFLPPWKLAEYQACEIAGYQVRRHDRCTFGCSTHGCRKTVSDFGLETRICIGCGPTTFIRYCSNEHEVLDFANHWRICGQHSLVLRKVIDSSTAPAHFSNMCPALKRNDGSWSYELHCQRYFACHSHGHYTIFDHQNMVNRALYWPKTDPDWSFMDACIERLLNIAILCREETRIIEYLYLTLRHLVSISPFCSEELLKTFKVQFGKEFGTHIFRATDSKPIFSCTCLWLGTSIPQHWHLKTCKLARETTDERQGLKVKVEELEAKYWILRAWRQQYLWEPDWKRRANGHGFKDVHVKEIRLGPGFEGWGALYDNIYDCDGDVERCR